MDRELIKNREEILDHGNSCLRQEILSIIQAGIISGDPGTGTRRQVRLSDGNLWVGTRFYRLDEINMIYIVGAGKGSFPIAEALETILGERISEGVCVVKRGETRRLKHIEIYEASHPIPDDTSLEGAKKILRIARQAGEGDVVFAAVTGGSSALVTMPPEWISLEEIQQLNDLLLKSGATIQEMNIVRKHLCQLKGGQLVAHIQPAEAITLTLDTAPEGMPWPDMCLADPSTFRDAISVLRHFDLWEAVSPSIQKYLQEGLHHPDLETIKSLAGMKTSIVSVGDPVSMCIAAAESARTLGYVPYILSTKLEGEAREAGISMAGIVKEIMSYQRPFKTPCALISGGETTVTIKGKSGQGGPNQEFALGFISKMKSRSEFACVSIDSDGTDGPTSIAGGVVDDHTWEEAEKKDLDINEYLKNHNSSEILQHLGSAIITGHTGTNLQNLRVVLIR